VPFNLVHSRLDRDLSLIHLKWRNELDFGKKQWSQEIAKSRLRVRLMLLLPQSAALFPIVYLLTASP
jgi:hypothetical protein